MSLKVWLPLNGNLKNNGLSSATIIASGAEAVSGGKLGGQTYSFDGSDDYISIDSSSLYDCFKGGEYPFTIAMWIYFNETTGGRGVLFGDYNLSGAINFNLELNGGSNWNNDIRFYWASSPDYRATNTAITSNTWVHLAVTYSGTQLKFYRNGILVNTRDGTLDSKNKTSGAFYLGRDSRTGATAFNGKLNDFRIYNECLSDKEIKEIYKTLILHYKLNNPTKIRDYSGYNRDAGYAGYLVDYPNSPIYDNCVRFRTGTPYITVPAINFTDFANNFTIAWWSNIANMNGKMAWGFSDGNRLNLYPTSSKFCCNTGDGASNAYMNGSSTVPFSTYNNGWHHYAITADGTNNKLYIDGEYKGTAQTYKGITGTQIILSGWDTGSSYKWGDGYLSDFRIYAVDLTADDIKQLSKTKMIVDNKQNLYTYEIKENNYAQLDYLEATGTQYVVTDVRMRDIGRVEFNFQYTDISTDQGLFGWYIISGYQNPSICLRGTVSDTKFHCVFGLDRSGNTFNTSLHRVTLLPGRELWDSGNSGSSGPATVTSTQTMPIFAIRNDNGASGFKDYSKVKLYYLKFYSSSGQLLGDFVPALDINDVACLYDKVTQQFYYNQGTGNFSYGSVTKDMRNKFKIQKNGILENQNFEEFKLNFPRNYKKLNFIQSSGTQYIDTKFKPDPNTRIVMNFYIVSKTNQDRWFGVHSANSLYYESYVNGNGYFAFAYQDDSGNWVSTSKSASAGKTITIDCDGKNKTYKLTGDYTYTGDLSSYTATKTSNYNLFLFGLDDSGSIALSANKPSKIKLYSCQIYDNGNLIRDFIPAEDADGTACLYDAVTEETFYNAGTGTFTKGDYVENTEALTYFDKVQIRNNRVISNNFYEI